MQCASALAERLRTSPEERTVTAFPDGSVDEWYAVHGAGDRRLRSRDAFAAALADGETDTFRLDRTDRRPGGQAVNAARQSHALGDRVTLFGHLDDPVLDGLPFRSASMGEPARIQLHEFDAGDVAFVRDTGDVPGWTFADLEAAAERRGWDPDAALAADAVCCFNWRSVDDMTGQLRALADRDPDGGAFVLDPGKVRTADRGAVADLFEVLGRLEDRYDVVVSANRAELRYAADSLDPVGDAEGDAALVAALRDAADVTAVVLHDRDAAVAATRRGTVRVRNVEVGEPIRHAGAGDRFGGGLAHALARGWDWEAALGLGNACASQFVATGETGDRSTLASFLDARA